VFVAFEHGVARLRHCSPPAHDPAPSLDLLEFALGQSLLATLSPSPAGALLERLHDPGVEAYPVGGRGRSYLLMKSRAQANVQFARERFARLDAILFARK